MKRNTVVLITIISVAAAVLGFLMLKALRASSPKLITARVPKPAALRVITYDFLDLRPFEQGRMWILTDVPGTNWAAFLLSIDDRRVLGEVANGWPEMMWGDPPQLLCAQPARVPISETIKDRLTKLITRISGGSLKFRPPPEAGLDYWLLDAKSGAATHLGKIAGQSSFPLSASPDFHHCFTARLGGADAIS